MNYDIETFEKYLTGKMPEKEKSEFETRLKDENYLLESFNLYRTSRSYLQAASDLQLKARLNKQGAFLYDEPQPLQAPQRPPYFSYGIAASVILAVGIGLNIFYQSYFKSYSAGELFLAYYEAPQPDNFASRDTNGDSLNRLWHKALSWYAGGNYTEAATLFDHLSTHQDFLLQSPAALYSGISYIEIEQPQKAIQAFDKVSAKNIVKQEAMWYKGLTLLKMQKTPEAREVLNEISSSPGHFKSKEAKELLEKMSRLDLE